MIRPTKPATWKLPTARIPLFGFEVDAVTMNEAVERIYRWTRARGRGRFVVTPNVDHAVLYQTDAELRASYANASLVLADGVPVVIAARLLGRPLPGRVAGSDLVPAVFDAAQQHGGLRVYLLGAGPGVAERAAQRIKNLWPHIEIVGTCSPPRGFEDDAQENEAILARIAAARPDVLIVGLGAPKQERWVNRYRNRIDAGVTLCVGATIDFLAGEKKRAPAWMRRGGLEWLYRVAREPKRLFKRYARDAWVFPRLVYGEFAAARGRVAAGDTHPG